jgi:hypothetical protein
MDIKVDKLINNNLGGIVYDFEKISTIINIVGLTKDKLLNKNLPENIINTSMFLLGEYIAILQTNKTFTKGQLALVIYSVNIESHFDHFADTLSPKTIQAFYEMQQYIKNKDESYFNRVKLTL